MRLFVCTCLPYHKSLCVVLVQAISDNFHREQTPRHLGSDVPTSSSLPRICFLLIYYVLLCLQAYVLTAYAPPSLSRGLQANDAMVGLVVASFLALLVVTLPHADLTSLSQANWPAAISILPILFVALVVRGTDIHIWIR